MLNEQVRQIMTKNPITVTANQSLEEVSSLLFHNDLNQLTVVQDGHLIGMITTHDLWKNSMSNDNTAKVVGDIMSKNVIKISPKDKVGTAAELFMDKRFKTLPVVNLRNELKGVVTAFDVMKHTLKQEYPRPILYRDIIEAT